MANCPVTVNLIRDSEYIGDSLSKINNNFETLRQGACVAEQLLGTIVSVRTFFYYGPNAPVNTTLGANEYSNDNEASRPSNSTIQTFVNSTSGLGLASAPLSAASQTGDIVYVIYQKTGWYSGQADYVRSGKGKVPYDYTVQVPVYGSIGIAGGRGRVTRIIGWRTETRTGYAEYTWSRNLTDQYSYYSPSYVIYKLTYNGQQYVVPSGNVWPKYVNSLTNSSGSWNDPKSWTTY